MSSSLYWIPALPLIGALFNLLLGRHLGRGTVHFVAVAAVAASFGVVLWTFLDPLWKVAHGTHHEGSPVELIQSVYTWIQVGDLKIEMAFRMDTLSAVMCLIITGVGTLIHIYSTGYMADEPRYAAYFGYLNLFTGSMLILVLGANLPVMFIGWEGVGVCSFLLIGFWFTNEAYANAGRKAFVVNRIGDFAFLIGMFLMYMATKDLGTTSLDFGTFRDPAAQAAYQATFWAGERYAMWACLFLFIGACGKSAQIPLYVWLPDAMAGPTPVSALIHAATMVTAGVYMVARMSFVFMWSSTALAIVAGVGAATALFAAFMAFAQTDLKRVLAYSTVSQLGFMFVAVGTGNWSAGIFHVGTHAFFKAGLFLGAGSVMHAMSGSGDIMKMGGLRKLLPITHATFLIYCLAISGIPPFAGFFSKDEILGGAWGLALPDIPNMYGKVLWATLTVAALGTAFYMWRLYFLVFAGESRADEETKAHIHESPLSMTFPLIVLAVLATVGGVIGFPHIHAFENLPSFTHWLDHWLEPSVAPSLIAHASDGRTAVLVAIATACGVAGIAGAWFFYRNGPSKQVDRFTQTELGGQLYQASKNKLWVDELYDSILVRPFRWLARALFELVDRFLIDTVLVGGSAWVVGLFGRLSRWVQNGQVQRYMVGIILGAAAVFFLATRASHPEISWRRVSGGIELRAYAGSGLAGNGAKLRWDLTGDGEWDLKPEALDALAKEPRPGEPPRELDPDKDYLSDPVLVRSNSEIGPYVRLEITDPLTRETHVVTTHVPMVVSQASEPKP